MKKLFLFQIAVCIILMFVSAASAGLNDGLVAYYPFNGNANDESGNGNDGTVNGAILMTDRFGSAESAFNFDGVNDYIQIPYAAALHPSVFSLSAWFGTTDTGNGMIITSDPDSYYCNHGYGLKVKTQKGWFNADPTGNCGDSNIIWSNNPLNDGGWHHMVSIFDGSQMMLYVDGVLQDQIATASTYSKPNSYLQIGRSKRTHDGGDQQYFHGSIDDIRIYDRPLSESEVQQLHIAPEPISSTLFIVGGATLGFRRWRKRASSRKV